MIVCKRAQHAGLALELVDLLGGEVTGTLVDVAQECVAQCYLIVEAAISLIEHGAVGTGVGALHLGYAGFLPVVAHDGLVGAELLKVPHQTGIDGAALVVDLHAAAEHQTAVCAGHESEIVFLGGELGLGCGVFGLDVKVADTRGRHAHRHCGRKPRYDISVEFHI